MNEKCWYKNVCRVAEEQGCKSDCIRYLEMSHLMENSGIPEKRQMPIALTCDPIDREAFKALNNIKKNILSFVLHGESLYITSEYTGNGKTSWAIKILLKFFDSIWAGNGFRTRGYFVHVPTFLNKMKDFNNNHDNLKSVVENADLVVWDDIASTKISDYDANQLLSFIDTRTYKGLSNIYTGNVVDKSEMDSILGSRLTSRICSGTTIILKGKDRR